MVILQTSFLLKHGAQVNMIGMKGITPLKIACLRNNSNMVKILLSDGEDINQRMSDTTPLILAC